MNTLKMLMNGAFGRKVPAEFAAENYDYEQALHDELSKLLCDETGRFNRYKFERNKYELFELLSKNLDEILPNSVSEALGVFTDVMRVPQGVRPEFIVTRGKQRGKRFVTVATPSGNYEAFRLDRERIDVHTFAIGGSGIVDFERYLDGVESITDIYEVITEGMIDRIFEIVQELLLQSWGAVGHYGTTKFANTFDDAAMVELCNKVAAYGAPVIYCSPEFAAEMVNAITYKTTTKIANEDLTDVRERGYIGKFHGVPVVVLPQSFTDDTNSKHVINPAVAYVVPAGKEKLVKLAFEGDSYFREWEHEGDNSIQLQAYLKVGLAMVHNPNYWGIYFNAGLETPSWANKIPHPAA